MTSITQLQKIAKTIGSGNFKLVDADTKIIDFSTSRQMRRNLERFLAKNPGQRQKMYYPKSVHLVKKNNNSIT